MRYGLSRLLNDNGVGNPIYSLRRMEQELDNLFGSFSGTQTTFPPVNVQKNDNEVKVTAEIPGYDAKNIDISVDGQVLTLNGHREEEKEEKESNWVVRERRSGSFSRSVALPWGVNASAVKADVKHGVLTVTLPRSETEKPRKIEIKAES